MREFTHEFQKVKNGLRTEPELKKNSEAFKTINGAFIESGIIRNLESPSVIDTSGISLSFPFPQIFKLNQLTIICSATGIYEYDEGSGVISVKLTVSEGSLWSVADYTQFILMTNGKDMVIRDGYTGDWSICDSCKIPYGTCICNLNGQIIIGGPETRVSSGFRG